MTDGNRGRSWKRRDVLRGLAVGAFAAGLPLPRIGTSILGAGIPLAASDIFSIEAMPPDPFTPGSDGRRHLGFDSLLHLMGSRGLPFYRSGALSSLAGPDGLIAAGDVVVIKVNAQWKYRGCTNSDLVRGVVQAILDHPDGFAGEVVIVENGQGRGSLACDTSSSYGGNREVHANAVDESHSFLWLVDRHFRDPRVSARLLDPIRSRFIGPSDHAADGYRKFENVSYPCFTTAGGRRVELKEGIWTGLGQAGNLKVLNIPVLKHHDRGGSETTGALKHMYGLVSMDDGQGGFRHYGGLGESCGKMIQAVARPSLTILDATWVPYTTLGGWPPSSTFPANRIAASQDPVALDAWAAANVLYPIDGNPRHHPSYPGIDRWLTAAQDTINGRGGLADAGRGIRVGYVSKSESARVVHSAGAGDWLRDAVMAASPGALELATVAGARRAAARIVVVSGPSGFAWRAETGASWLSAYPASGRGAAFLTVAVDGRALDPGTYSSVVRIVSSDAANSPLTTPVALKVLEGRSILDRPRRTGD